MTDRISVETRSKIMRAVKTKNTKPEMVVRKLLTILGYRYRLHPKDLPGKPDIAFKGRKKVIFVHGCFWHGHDCPRGKMPPGEFWTKKLQGNIGRDLKTLQCLEGAGWRILTIWECQLSDIENIKSRLKEFLKAPSAG